MWHLDGGTCTKIRRPVPPDKGKKGHKRNLQPATGRHNQDRLGNVHEIYEFEPGGVARECVRFLELIDVLLPETSDEDTRYFFIDHIKHYN